MNTLPRYILGFLLSLGLTAVAFWLVQAHMNSVGVLSPEILILALVVLALIQLVVQAVCFLRVGAGTHAAWNTALLSFTFFVVVVIAGWSLWIMSNLTNQTRTAEEIFKSEAIVSSSTHD